MIKARFFEAAKRCLTCDIHKLLKQAMTPTFLGFTELEGFTGIGHPIDDCMYKAKWVDG